MAPHRQEHIRGLPEAVRCLEFEPVLFGAQRGLKGLGHMLRTKTVEGMQQTRPKTTSILVQNAHPTLEGHDSGQVSSKQ